MIGFYLWILSFQDFRSVQVSPTPFITVQDVDDAEMMDVPIEVKEVHISHVFNSFRVASGSMEEKEHKLVAHSWRVASEFAAVHGVIVEHIDLVFPEDQSSSPDFANVFLLEKGTTEPFHYHRLPQIGELFEKAKSATRGEIVVYTNRDIGAMKDFYVKVWELSNKDWTQSETQLHVLENVYRFFKYCIEYSKEDSLFSNTDICLADAFELFKTSGGCEDIFSHVQRDIARMYLRDKFNTNKKKKISSSLAAKWYKQGGGISEFESKDISNDILGFKPQPHDASQSCNRPSAFTITRMDLSMGSVIERNIEKVYTYPNRSAHPGNDCFVFPRHMIPQFVFQSKHPLGYRPWGKWLSEAFEWEFGKTNAIWRVFQGTPFLNYTFHIGLSGMVATNWMSMFSAKPDFFTGLVIDWNEVSSGRYSNLYKVPSYCKSPEMFRNSQFCRNSQVLQDGNICRGNVRYSCSRFENPRSRDGICHGLSCNRIRKAAEEGGTTMTDAQCRYCIALDLHKNGKVNTFNRVCTPIR